VGSLRSAYATVTGRGYPASGQRRDAAASARAPATARAPADSAAPGAAAPNPQGAAGADPLASKTTAEAVVPKPAAEPAAPGAGAAPGTGGPPVTGQTPNTGGPPVTGPTPVPAPASATAARLPAADGGSVLRQDLRGTAVRRTLRFPTGDRVVVSGLPGSGKSTLIRRVLAVEDAVCRIDSQDVRERWAAALPRLLPYAVYRPLVRIAHYAGLRRALASGASVVVHDCGSQAWVRNWLARDARRRGRALHLVLLDVPPATALRSQAERGRTVSDYAFMRHRGAVRRLIAEAESGRLPRGIESVVLLDRGAAGALAGMAFD
jgi:predicted kinase